MPFFKIYLFFNRRIIALQTFVVFCQTSIWISHGYTYVLSLEPLSHLHLHPTFLDWYRAPVWVPWDTQHFPIQFSHSVVSDSLWPHGLQHARPPCPSPTPGACSNSCSSGQWCHPTISSSGVPFSSCLQSFQASGSFPKSQFITSGGQSIGVSVSASASVLPMDIQYWFPLGLTGLISLQFKELSRVFSNTTVPMGYLFYIW